LGAESVPESDRFTLNVGGVRMRDTLRTARTIAIAASCAGVMVVAATAGASTRTFSRCPTKLVQLRPSSWTPTHHELVPPGPVAMRLCRYTSLNADPRLSLEFTIKLVANFAHVVHDFDAIPSTPSNRSSSCPNDDGATVLVTFGYRSGHADTVSVDIGGCPMLSNGSIHEGATQQLIADIKRASDPKPPKDGQRLPAWWLIKR
jgi:hypothetical protein